MDKKTKTKILLIVKYPPPLTGYSWVNQQVCQSKLLHSAFEIKEIRLIFHSNTKVPGLSTLFKLIKLIKYLFLTFFKMVYFRPEVIYFTISPVNRFHRDSIIVAILKLFKSHIVYHLHGKGINDNAVKSNFNKKLYKYAFKNVYVIALSDELTKDYSSIFNGKSFVLNNGIFPISINRNKKKNLDGSFKILFLSNLIESKGLYILIEALSILKQKHTNFHCTIVGNDNYNITVEQLAEIIKKKSLNPYITYLGAKYDEEKYNILLSSDVLAYPTYDDAFPLVILEAMQTGIPIIGTKEGGIPDIILDNKTGFIIDRKNSVQLAEKLEILLEDRKKAREMGIEGQKIFYEKYTFDIFEKKLLSIFSTIINS